MKVTFAALTRRALGTAALAMAGAFFVPGTAAAQEIVARLSYHWAPTHHSSIYCEEFAKRVNERGQGKIRIDTFPSAQLFGIRETMGALTSGAVELGGVVATVAFPPVNKNYNVEGLPGAFQSFEELRAFFQEDEVGQQVWNDLLTRTRTQLVAYNPVGPYMTFTSIRALDEVEAFKGLKARYLAGLERPRWEALGSNAISLPTEEIYTSLQNGMIDTLSTVPSAIEAYSWWEYLKYGQKPYQFFADSFIMANQSWWDGLPDDVRQILIEVGEEISRESTESIMAHSEEVLERFVAEQNGRIDELSGDELEKLRTIDREKVLPGVSNLIDPHVLEAVQAFTTR